MTEHRPRVPVAVMVRRGMKVIRVTMDEAMLEALDAEDEVRCEGRSAVICHAVAEYLRRRREERIDEQYRRAYAERSADPDLDGWAAEEAWPEQ